MDNATFQVLINVAFGVTVFLGGWVIRTIFFQINKVRDELFTSMNKSSDDYKALSQNITNIAISLPEKYVQKADLDKLIDHVNSRFDKLDAKLDKIASYTPPGSP